MALSSWMVVRLHLSSADASSGEVARQALAAAGFTGRIADVVASDPTGAAAVFLANLVEGIDRPGLKAIERRAIVDVEVEMMMSREIRAALEVLEPFVVLLHDPDFDPGPIPRDPVKAAHRRALEADSRRALRDFGDKVVNAVRPLAKPDPRPPAG